MPRRPAPAALAARRTLLRGKIDALNAAATRLMASDVPAGLRDAAEAERLATIAGHSRGLADSLYAQMHGRIQGGEFAAAAACGRRALALYRGLGDAPAEARALHKIALVFTHAGDYPRAEQFALRAARLAQRAGEPVEALRARRHLGVVQYNRGRHAAALDTFEAALREAAAAGEPGLVAMLRMNIGLLHTDAGRWEIARGYLQESLDHFSTAGDRLWEATLRTNLGVLFQKQARHPEAAAEFARCLRLARAAGYTRLKIHALINLADALFPQGHHARADTLLREAERGAARTREKRSLAHALECRARLERARGREAAARAAASRALALARELGETALAAGAAAIAAGR